ncbi:MAG: glycosyltransferase [Hyphomicrobiaceae bacterium]
MSGWLEKQRAPRVLLVGFSERYKYFGQMFYATFQIMRNGFIRAGASAFLFSDRDNADFAAPFAIRQIGKAAANRNLIKLVDLLSPDAICLMHCDLIQSQTVEEIRRRNPKVRIFSYFIDPLGRPEHRQRFERYVAISDVSFATTAGSTLAQSRRLGSVGFMPNPVDFSIFHARAFDQPDSRHDFFFAGKPKGRDALLHVLEEKLPNRSHGYYLRRSSRGMLAISGAHYLDTLSQSKIAINAEMMKSPYLYSSDRIAQYFSAGCLVAQPAAAAMDDLYGRDTMLIYDGVDDLAEKSEALLSSDQWRDIARHGQDRAKAVSDSEIVAHYMLDRCFEQQTREWPSWSSEFYARE